MGMTTRANTLKKLRQRIIALGTVFSFFMLFVNPVIAACAPEDKGCCCDNGDSKTEGESIKRSMSCCNSDCECSIEAPNPIPAAPDDAVQSADMSSVEYPLVLRFGALELKLRDEAPGHVSQRGPPPSHWPPLYIQYDTFLI